MEDLHRRLLRIIFIIIGTYFTLTYSIETTNEDLAKIILLISIIFMTVDTYIPRVHLVKN